ncbi:DUF6297 family protein [Gordonia malaquae]|uniref:DUF6297 family protein n=1 Tax=Gordonia malaquae TaxID=410332 RepID=UPI0030FF0A2A
MAARRKSWMSRNDVSVIDLVLIVGVGGGIASWVLAPARVATVVELSAWADSHTGLVTGVVVVVIALVVGRFAATWGPVRVSREAAQWALSGPASRVPVLARRAAASVIVATTVSLGAAGAAVLVMPSHVWILMPLGAGAGLVGVGAAYAAQLSRDSRIGGRRPRRTAWSPGRLHRRTFAPRDGYAGAVGLAVTMMDGSWIDDARVTRWKSRKAATAGRLSSGPLSAFVTADLRRLARHPEQLVRWAAWTAVAVLVPIVLEFHHVPLLVSTIAVTCAGNATSGGLKSTSDRALRRAFGVSDAEITAAHCVIPGLATALSALCVGFGVGIGPAAGAVLVVGAVAAVIRRATRPALPYGSPAVTDGVLTGATFQPALLTAQLRGPMLTVVTALIAGRLL